ncbi:MAG: cytochrome b/b6 domain-containing protein [Gemmatimonadales bacterium]
MNTKLARRVAVLAALAVLPTPTSLLGQEREAPADGGEHAADLSSPVTCEKCHTDFSFLSGKTDSAAGDSALLVTEAMLEESVHGQAVYCVECHQAYEGYPHPEGQQPADCSECHDDVEEEYAQSLHGYALARGDMKAPTCEYCHGHAHEILESLDPRAPTFHAKVPELCASCHGEAGLITDRLVRLPQTFTAYAESVHGRTCAEGGACCTDCHGVHELRGPLDPKSKISHLNVASTCGACHDEISEEFQNSIHGRALAAGLGDSPTCNDCHGEHHILSPHDPDATTYSARLAIETCGTCHDDPEIIDKYSLQGGVVGSYVDSYHGWTTRRGYERAATCVSCHSAHAVLPKTDPASTVNPANVLTTCRTCHPDADPGFAEAYDHVAASITRNPVNRLIRAIYVVLITVVIGGMLFHNALIFNYYLILSRRESLRRRAVVRFDRFQIIHHMVLAVSFIVLVITGFALRYPDAAWVQLTANLGLTEPMRSTVHRAAGVLLVVFGIWHVIWILTSRHGRREMKAMFPSGKDFKDLVDNLRYHTFRSKREAWIGRYGYPEKVEYWSLVWGIVLMTATGLVLWFPEATARLFPSWTIAASQTIHFYEAWLAALAIVVWHFFFVIFHPDVYPMNWAWLTGRFTEEHVKHHHPEWYEELARGETDDTITEGEESPA